MTVHEKGLPSRTAGRATATSRSSGLPKFAALPGRPLCASVLTMLREIGSPSTGAVGDCVGQVADALDDPLRIAVVGRLNTGKSTLVNALLGQRVAATAHGERTKGVTWYRYGHPERAELMMRDGSVAAVPLLHGGLPDDLGVDPGGVLSASVWLSNDLLRELTLIDTPGLGSINTQFGLPAKDLLTAAKGQVGPVMVADALLFVVRETLTQDELDALRKLRARLGSSRGLATSTIGVLTRIDQFCDLECLHESADALAAQRALDLREHVSCVVPVIGLLAETAETASLLESDIADLERLAVLPPDHAQLLLASADEFLEGACKVGLGSPHRLLELLDLYGLAQAVADYRKGLRTAGGLRRELSGISGIDRLRRMTSEMVTQNADALRAHWAMRTLRALSFTSDTDTYLSQLRGAVEQLADSPAMHRLVEYEERQAVLAGLAPLPEPWRSDFLQVTGAGSDAERLGGSSGSDLEALARAGVGRWRSFAALGTNPIDETLARVAIRSYTLAHARLASSVEVGS